MHDVIIKSFTLLFNTELNIIIYINLDQPAACRFIFCIVEVFDVGVFECIRDRDASTGVEGQQTLQQVETVLAALPLEVLEPQCGGLLHALQQSGGQRGVDAFDVRGGGQTDYFDHLLDLVQGRRAREQWFAQEQLAQDTATTPHVDGFGVDSAPQQDFGCSLPAGGHLVGEDGRLVAVVLLRD